jgi:hypothetical protein
MTQPPLTEARNITGLPAGLPRDWIAREISPNTPFPDEPSVMIPPGVYLLGGFTGDLEDGANLVLRIEQALGGEEDELTHLDLARALADRLNGGGR